MVFLWLIGLCFAVLLSSFSLRITAIQEPTIALGLAPLRARIAIGDPTSAGLNSQFQPSRRVSQSESQSDTLWRSMPHRFHAGRPLPVIPRRRPSVPRADPNSAAACKTCPPPQDFYQLLNVRQGASPEEIKNGYRAITKRCHPDIAGKEATDTCSLVNEAYKTLMDPILRQKYNSESRKWDHPMFQKIYAHIIEGYDGTPVSRWLRDDPGRAANDQRGVFVDEGRCVGCLMCVDLAPKTIGAEDLWGRARVHTQWGDDEKDIDIAMEACPSECIHYVKKTELTVLEWCMTRAHRVSTGNLHESTEMYPGTDPFDIAKTFMKHDGTQQARSSHPAFKVEMQSAWDKLKKETKEAWTGKQAA